MWEILVGAVAIAVFFGLFFLGAILFDYLERRWGAVTVAKDIFMILLVSGAVLTGLGFICWTIGSAILGTGGNETQNY